MLAQHLHDPAIGREVVINRDDFLLKGAVFHLENISKAIRIGFIGTEEAKILLFGVSRKNVPHQLAKLSSVPIVRRGGLFDFNCIFRKVRQVQVYQQLPAIGMWIGPHSTITFWCQGRKFRDETSLLVKKLFWFVAAHPFFKYF